MLQDTLSLKVRAAGRKDYRYDLMQLVFPQPQLVAVSSSGILDFATDIVWANPANHSKRFNVNFRDYGGASLYLPLQYNAAISEPGAGSTNIIRREIMLAFVDSSGAITWEMANSTIVGTWLPVGSFASCGWAGGPRWIDLVQGSLKGITPPPDNGPIYANGVKVIVRLTHFSSPFPGLTVTVRIPNPLIALFS